MTAKSAAFGPVMAKLALVAATVPVLQIVRVMAAPTVPTATLAKVSCDGVMEIGPADVP